MPELPEVEVVKEGLKRIIKPSNSIRDIHFMRANLRSPLPHKMKHNILNQEIISISRRAKYILLKTNQYTVLSHLGMTGSWRLLKKNEKLKIHDHVCIEFLDGSKIIYNDPRRFGVFDIIENTKIDSDKRLKNLGPEPLLKKHFNAKYLFEVSRNRHVPVKTFIMDQKIVVGVGNIYASEALFLAGIRPLVEACKISQNKYEELVQSVQIILKKAIRSGGSTIRNFSQASGESGYFQNHLFVYGRDQQSCRKCRGKIRSQVLSGRNTFWCVNCQK